MKMKNQKKAGFTLVELMVVAIIVAILAAVAIPLMAGNKKRAMATEAEAGIGTIQTQLRVYYAEHDNYPTATAAAASTLEGIDTDDLDGQYFDTDDYSYTSTAAAYTITCAGDAASGRGPNVGDANGITITLTDQGTWTRAGI